MESSQAARPVPPAHSREPLIRLEGVHKWFGNLHVLKGVDLAMLQRDVVVVIGPSGGGKSTLLAA